MSENIEEELLRMLEAITINIALPRYIENISILLDPEFYFEVSQIIFPELQMKIIKIQENQILDPEEKMQHLINLIGKQLSIDLSPIRGEGILDGHLQQIHYFLGLLWKCSEDLSDRGSGKRVRSEDRIQKDENEGHKYIRSARDRNQTRRSQPVEEKKRESRGKRYRSVRSGDNRKSRSKREERKNIYNSVLNTVWNEKNRMAKASVRDNRSKKNQSLKQAKNKYQSFLLNQTKNKKARKNRERFLNKTYNPPKFMLKISDFKDIDNFFQSFALRFRDQKEHFLRRIQEIDRMCYQNKVARQQKASMQLKTMKQIERINNEHNIRSKVLQQKENIDQKSYETMKRDYEGYLRKQKKELKQNKTKELKNIRSYIEQENHKLLMQFEEGGSLERTIMNMYKKF